MSKIQVNCKAALRAKNFLINMSHTVRSTYKNDHNMNGYYKSCLQKVLSDNVKSIAFCCGTIQRKYSRMDQVKFVESSLK